MTSTAAHPTAHPENTKRPRQGSLRGIALLVLAVLAVSLVSLAVGSRDIGLGRVVDVLLHPDGSSEATIVRELRVPRTIVGLVAGLCLGVAGALMQGHTRNPLADPGLLGVTAGASFAVVFGIYALGIDDPLGYAWFALVGAGGAAALVFLIGSTKRGPDPVTLVLAGTAVSALLGAFTQAILLRDVTTLDDYRFWVVGSVNGPRLEVLVQIAPFMIVGLLIAVAGAGGLNMLQLGDDVARSLGMSPGRHKVGGILAVMLLAGAATALCGPIGFVGLVVPHIARFLGGVDYRWVVPYAGLIGGLLVVTADVIGRLVVRPGELQVGIMMALVGGPVFIILVRRLRLVRL
jgi:iron complex transport system permease protein